MPSKMPAASAPARRDGRARVADTADFARLPTAYEVLFPPGSRSQNLSARKKHPRINALFLKEKVQAKHLEAGIPAHSTGPENVASGKLKNCLP